MGGWSLNRDAGSYASSPICCSLPTEIKFMKTEADRKFRANSKFLTAHVDVTNLRHRYKISLT